MGGGVVFILLKKLHNFQNGLCSKGFVIGKVFAFQLENFGAYFLEYF